MQLQFTPISLEDKGKVLHLLKNAAEKIAQKQINHWQYWKNPSADKVRWVEEGIQQKQFYFISDITGGVLGMVRILDEDALYWGRRLDKARYVHSLVVKEKYNGKGIGAEVLSAIAANAKKEACQFIRLDADAGNPKLCTYYEELGFTSVGVKKIEQFVYNLYEKKI